MSENLNVTEPKPREEPQDYSDSDEKYDNTTNLPTYDDEMDRLGPEER